MVYSPKTWISNEVITKDALNNIEGGIANAETWSNEIIDADKDMQGKSLTNLKNVTLAGNISAPQFKVTASDFVQFTYLPEIMHTVKNFKLPEIISTGSTIRIVYNLDIPPNCNGYTQILKNGVEVFKRTTQGAVDEIISVTGGDVIGISAYKSQQDFYARVESLKFLYGDPFAISEE